MNSSFPSDIDVDESNSNSVSDAAAVSATTVGALSPSALPPPQAPPTSSLYVNANSVISASARTSITRVDDMAACTDLSAQSLPPSLPSLPAFDALAGVTTTTNNNTAPEPELESELGQVAGPSVSTSQAPSSHHQQYHQPPDATTAATSNPEVPPTMKTSLTFLLITGRRRAMTFEPDTTVGRVKELVWNSWSSDWQEPDARPPTPSHIRILYLGKILQDDDTLSHLKFPTHPSNTLPPSSTIVHLSIRPYAPPADDITKSARRGGSRTADGEDGASGAGCCSGCVIC